MKNIDNVKSKMRFNSLPNNSRISYFHDIYQNFVNDYNYMADFNPSKMYIHKKKVEVAFIC